MQSARIPRFFVEAPPEGEGFAVSSDQAHYLRNVLRARKGQPIVVFDGHGHEYLAEIQRLSKAGAALTIKEPLQPLPESCLELTLIQAVAKSDAMDSIVQKATELGVRCIRPVVTEYGVVRLDAERAERRLEHWRRIARGACEQSGRHAPPIIEGVRQLPEALAEVRETALRIVLDPYATTAFPRQRETHDLRPCHLLIGPEGGFSERDLASADRAGFVHVKLGPRTLRVETAVFAACSLAQAHWGDMR